MRKRWQTALSLLFLFTRALAAQESSVEQEALKRAKILQIIGITTDINSTLKDLGAKVTQQEIKIELSADVLFDFDKADLRPGAFSSLETVAAVLKEYPKGPVLIEGHTDSKGADAYNQALSEKRAASVKDWLVQKGAIPAARMTTRGWGKTKPVVSNTTPDGKDDPTGRQKNRRVEITLRKT